MKILGLHHITLISSNAQRTVNFYTQILGLRLVKQTVNFDAPESYHLYFGNQTGAPSTVITFFEWPNAKRGNSGIGGTHHFALQVKNYQALLKWKRRLTDQNIKVDGPLDRHYFQSIYFTDPDKTIIEIATEGPGWAIDENLSSLGQEYREPPHEMIINNRNETRINETTWAEPTPEITSDMILSKGMHHITAIGKDIKRTHAFYSDLLGLKRVKMTSNFDDPNSAHWYWGIDDGKPGTIVTYFERDPSKAGYAQMGAGQTHHFALSVANEEEQIEWRAKLIKAGLRVSPIMDRIYFKSIYTNDPDGHIIELATVGPGFLYDESIDKLGSELQLPPWLESKRELITQNLQPLVAVPWKLDMENTL